MGVGCGGCFAQIPEIEPALTERGIRLVSVVVDDPEITRIEAERYGATGPIALDPDRSVSEAYGMLGVYGHGDRPSHSFVRVDADGTISDVLPLRGDVRPTRPAARRPRPLRPRVDTLEGYSIDGSRTGRARMATKAIESTAGEGRTVEFAAQGMTCGSCAARIQKTLAKHAGVTDAEVNYATGRRW